MNKKQEVAHKGSIPTLKNEFLMNSLFDFARWVEMSWPTLKWVCACAYVPSFLFQEGFR